VQNDAYHNLRKAQVDGEVVQCNTRTANTKYCWVDMCDSNFTDDVAHYKIKPKTEPFKIGDWVVGNGGCPQQAIIETLDEDIWKLWQPQVGEWVCEWSHVESGELNIFKWNGITGTAELLPLDFINTLKDRQ